MNDVQWVRNQIVATCEQYGFSCSQPIPEGNYYQIYIQAYDFENRQWGLLGLTKSANSPWSIYAGTDFFGPYESADVSSIAEITTFIANHAY